MTKSVMVIDDSLLVRRQVGNALKGLGYTVVEAVDGLDALEKLEAQSSLPHLIICDVNMPRMNGIEFLERLASRGSIPVVMLTTEGEPELIQRAKSLGAKGWLIKPFRPEYLEATAKKWAPLPASA